MSKEEKIVSLKACPMHMPEGWEPPVPAFSAAIGPKDHAVALYVGLQNPNSRVLSEFNTLIAKIALPVHDLALFTDRAGCKNYVLVAYFPSSKAHAQWEDASGFSAWRERAEHRSSAYGLWLERFVFEPGQFETLFFNAGQPGRGFVARPMAWWAP